MAVLLLFVTWYGTHSSLASKAIDSEQHDQELADATPASEVSQLVGSFRPTPSAPEIGAPALQPPPVAEPAAAPPMPIAQPPEPAKPAPAPTSESPPSAETQVAPKTAPMNEPPPTQTTQPDLPPPATNAVDPFQPGSVWVGGFVNKLKLTVLERRGEAFTARFELGTRLVREMQGVVNGNRVSWPGKDVGANGVGILNGDTNGMISRDQTGNKIDLEWRCTAMKGSYTLLLRTGADEIEPTPMTRENR